jgi:CPA2 family monovalent cation:H+ antiporter-2
MTFRRFGRSKPLDPSVAASYPRIIYEGSTLTLFRIATVLWVAGLTVEFFPVKNVLFIVAAFLFGIFVLFYKQSESSYVWLEKRFMHTFEAKEAKEQSEVPVVEKFRHLVPWDAHLIRIKVHPNANLVGKTIAQAKIRTQYGLSIMAIQRGIKTIVTPRPTEMILPKDELLLLGTDEQLESITPDVEVPGEVTESGNKHLDYKLRQLLIAENSPLKGSSIRDSKIGWDFEVMVVGIERNNLRIMNPESDLPFQAGDTLWVVGENEHLNRLAAQCTPYTGKQ